MKFNLRHYNMVPEDQHAVLWITEFPMFEWNEVGLEVQARPRLESAWFKSLIVILITVLST